MTAIIIVVIIIVVFYPLYVRLIKAKNATLEALSGIDVQLTKRANVIPNILKIAQAYIDHERSLLTEITKLRSNLNSHYDKNSAQEVEKHLAQAQELGKSMSQLQLTVENYPELKSDKAMIEAMEIYSDIEANISAARRFYNSSVNQLNSAVEIFPGSVIAKMISVKSMPFYLADEAQRAPINVDDYLK